MCCFFFSSRRRHTRCALVTGVQTCALPILMAQAGLIFRPPHWRARLSGGWEKDNVSITAIGSYIGPVRDDRFQPITSVPAFVTVDTVLHLTPERNSGLLGGLGFTVSRSEERRVGKEGGSKWRSRWWQ